MEYITEIKAFYRLQQINELSTGTIALWHALMFLNNECYWKDTFSVSNKILELYTGLSRQAILKNRNILKQIGLIDFIPNGTKSTTYKLNAMSNSCQVSCQNSSQSGCQSGCQNSSQSVVKLVAQSNRHKDKDIDIDIKEKYKEKNPQKPKKTPYGEYSHVLLTEEEHSKLCSEYANADELIAYLDKYIEMKGYKVNNCYLAIKEWVADAATERKAKRAGNGRKSPLNNFAGEKPDFDELTKKLIEKQKKL